MEFNQINRIVVAAKTSAEPRRDRVPAWLSGPAPSGVELGSLTAPSIHEPWFVSLKKQIAELLTKQPPLPRYRGAPIRRGDKEARLALMNLHALHEPWFVSLKRQIKAFQAEKQLPPLKVSSKPVPVKSIWGAYDYKQQGVSTSVAVHVVAVVLIFFTSSAVPVVTPRGSSIDLVMDFDISPYLADLLKAPPGGKSGGGGGGGQNSPLPPSKGKLPRFSMTQLATADPGYQEPRPEAFGRADRYRSRLRAGAEDQYADVRRPLREGWTAFRRAGHGWGYRHGPRYRCRLRPRPRRWARLGWRHRWRRVSDWRGRFSSSSDLQDRT